MPNYYIQARTGTFNPMSFDEMVKPLDRYKEYYEQNEEAISEMKALSNMWKDIANSELDSEYADKYNQYSENLDNAAQQLSNGMSYNLRNQIQNLRSQSAMVKQIENAYNLRAKDIDAYNELMLQDPSRIGATNPRNIKLNEYFGGPVKMNYGVSGDRLNKLGASQSYNMADTSAIQTELSIIDQMQVNGYDINSIMDFLESNNSMVYKMAENIMAGDNMPFNKGSREYDEALLQTINGIANGVQLRQAELAKAKASKKGNSEGDDDWDLNKDVMDGLSSSIGIPNYVSYDKDSRSGALIQEMLNDKGIQYKSAQDDPTRLVSSKLLQLQEQVRQMEENGTKDNWFSGYQGKLTEIQQEKQRLEDIENEFKLNGIPGETAEEKYRNYVQFYVDANRMDNKAILSTGNSTDIEKLNKLYKEKYKDSTTGLKYYEDGKWKDVDSETEKQKILKDGTFRYTTKGMAIMYNGKDGNRVYMLKSYDDKTNEFNRDIDALNNTLLTMDGQNALYQKCVQVGAYLNSDNLPVQVGNSDIYCYLSSDGNRYVFMRTDGTNYENIGSILRYDANAAMDFLRNITFAVGKNDLLNVK